jgi:hypothetical protein
MKMKMLCGLLLGTLALAGTAMGAVFTDAATNYPGGSWTNGSNGGTGFMPWSIVADAQGGWAGSGIWDSTVAGLMMGEAFGYVGKVGYIDIDRVFNQALNTNDIFEFDFGVNYDSGSGNKGINLYANGKQVINLNHGGFPGTLTLNGAPAVTNYGTNTMHWKFTQVAANQIGVGASGRDGVETFATTVTTEVAYGYMGSLRFYSSGLPDDGESRRQSYFNNLKLTQEGTPPPEPAVLKFTAGTFDPIATNSYSYTLERSGPVDNAIVLTSSNTNAVTVPPGATFSGTQTVLEVVANVISLTSGSATIIASNVASGVWAEYVVTPVPPSLNFTSGTWDPSATGGYLYRLERMGAVDNVILLSSTASNVLTVAPSVNFITGSNTIDITATVVSLTNGQATLIATNVASGAWAEFTVKPYLPGSFNIGPIATAPGSMTLVIPNGYSLGTVYGADTVVTNQGLTFQPLTNGYTVVGGSNVVISTVAPAPSRRLIRLGVVLSPI